MPSGASGHHGKLGNVRPSCVSLCVLMSACLCVFIACSFFGGCFACVCVCVRACVRACVCVHECMSEFVCLCLCVSECMCV